MEKQKNYTASESSSEANQKSNTELLNEISFILEHSHADDMDLDTVFKNLDILDARATINVDDVPRDSWESLSAEYQARKEKAAAEKMALARNKPARKNIRRRRILARTLYAAILIIISLFVLANASGVISIQSIVKQVGDKLFIAHNPSGELELPEGTESEYRSLREALDQNGMEDALCPSWIPKDYVIEDVIVMSTSRRTVISAIYSSNKGEMSVVITKAYSDETVNTIETEENGIKEVTLNGLVFYISKNLNVMQATGQDDIFSYSFVGNVAEDEIERIIQSLYR